MEISFNRNSSCSVGNLRIQLISYLVDRIPLDFCAVKVSKIHATSNQAIVVIFNDNRDRMRSTKYRYKLRTVLQSYYLKNLPVPH